jgi:hypothetical protein
MPDQAPAKGPVDLAKGKGFPMECRVTQPPKTAFVPPKPWSEQPPNKGTFWIGEAGLWTALPLDGSWGQLALGEKFWWWSGEFDASKNTTPDLTLTARRLDGKAPDYQVSDATNGYHPSFHEAILIGVRLPAPGCWEITGEYKGHLLSFVLWVPGE